MPASIGVNLRVTGHCRQGGRKYMEDFFSVAYQQTEDEKDLEYAFFGIYDGHGGAEAAAFAKEHLMESIVKHKSFWSEDDEDVLRSIKDGFIATHYAMWRTHDKWPKTSSGLPSTAGTTASVAFMRRGKIYIGHVGDSGITLGYQESGCPDWRAKPLTKDHKPESEVEMARIEQSGGKVISKSGVPRVVWNRPRIGHKGPVRRSTPIVDIPFLAVARSLGDLWSYNSALNEFVVSPTPDVSVIPINTETFRCLIFGTDGLYNMLSSHMAVHIVQQAEKHNEQAALSGQQLNRVWINPSKYLVEKALERWNNTKMRADNTSVITLMLDPPGPPRAEVLRNKRNSYTSSGLQIETRYQQQAVSDALNAKENNDAHLRSEHGYASVANVAENCTTELQQIESDLERIETKIAEYDNHFVPKPRESTYTPSSDTKYSQHSPTADTKYSQHNPQNVPHNPKNGSITRNILMSPRNDAGAATSCEDEVGKSFKIGINNSKYKDLGVASCSTSGNEQSCKNETDIQINEISSSSIGLEQSRNENCKTRNSKSQKMKEKSGRRSLRSSDIKETTETPKPTEDVSRLSADVRADAIGSSVSDASKKKKRAEQNVTHERGKLFKMSFGHENRCDNPATRGGAVSSAVTITRGSSKPQNIGMPKRRFILRKMVSSEKKRLLQNVLFGNRTPQPQNSDVSLITTDKPKRNALTHKSCATSSPGNNKASVLKPKNVAASPTKSQQTKITWTQNYTKVTPTKCEVTEKPNGSGNASPPLPRILRNSPVKPNSAAAGNNGGVKAKIAKMLKKKNDREIRKTTLAQKLRLRQDTFKAKLRARSSSAPVAMKLKKQKMLTIKKTKKS